ncbi:hypothetical protein NE547_07275 [Flavonifractor sp. DFI.6.63]|jgi:hypothetical protein|uniref:hypothetical protein n=1 Tax=Flavonifractor TaxID=946234 RepID=UPI00189BACED|nr:MULTISPECIES: hypothetical protein [Flavonifractor]MCG4705052.1 hypothetical protein [Flavonifractor plautii]MCQ5029337.1 hypothetical protein [Flavonifractor sp. DFI.6.63]UBS61652.1 hypothetical protein LCR02_01650 [Flavonifractor plautii]DAP92933.1 MAG TPA: hypothetical protein [Caudoviricetes sp.]
MKLKFIGEDGSMGLRTGEVYDTRIFIKGECLWVEWKVNLYTVKSCPYISTQSFAQNWELPRYNSK